MPQQLNEILSELGLTQYRSAFVEQGFDTWDTILDITESDMDALGVKLGHRRKLQRRIAKFRGVGPGMALASPTRATSDDSPRAEATLKQEQPSSFHHDGRGAVPGVLAKRKYRRHPKPDESAPERPPSAYVLFSNKMREDLKGKNLSFTEIAKLVGENWQSLPPAEREPFETQAQAAKDKYNHDLAEYKKTPEYKKYMVYLQEFKAKHSNQTQDKDAFKRIKLADFGSASDDHHDLESAAGTTTSVSASHRQQHRVRMGLSSGTHGSRSGSESPHEHEHEHEHENEHEHQHENEHEQHEHSPRAYGSRKHRASSAVSASDSHYSDSPTPGPTHSPIQSHMSDMGQARQSPHAHMRSLSPRETPQGLHAAPVRAGHGAGGTHVSLPSLSDMFDKRQLSPTGLAPAPAPAITEPGSSYHPGPAAAAGDASPGIPPHGMAVSTSSTSNGSASSYSTNGYPRSPMDGSLPIHALLSDKASAQSPNHLQYQHPHQTQHPAPQHQHQHPAQHQHQHPHHQFSHHVPHPARHASPGHSPPPQSWSYAQEHPQRYGEPVSVPVPSVRPPAGGAHHSFHS